MNIRIVSHAHVPLVERLVILDQGVFLANVGDQASSFLTIYSVSNPDLYKSLI